MAQDTTGFDASLKDVYLGSTVDQLNERTELLDLFTKEDVKQYKWEGRQVVMDLRSSRNAGIKATSEGGLLPAAGKQGYANLKIPMKFWEGRIELTAQVMKASRSDKGSFIRAMDSEQKGLVDDLARQRNRAISGFGQGTLGVISSGANSATQAIKDPGNVVGTTNPLRFLPAGAVVAITDSTGATLRGVQTISSVSTPNIVLDASVNTTTGDLVSLGSNATSPGESSYNLEPMGILGIADSTTYVSSFHNIDRSQAANAFFRSNILSSVGVLSVDLLQRAIDDTQERSGEVIDAMLCHVSVRREVLKLTEADRRYMGADLSKPDPGTDAGRFKGNLMFNGLPIRTSKDFPYGIVAGVNKGHLLWFPESEGEWADEDGAVLFRVSNKDNFEARYRLFENFSTDKGVSHFRADGVTATVSTSAFSG